MGALLQSGTVGEEELGEGIRQRNGYDGHLNLDLVGLLAYMYLLFMDIGCCRCT
jgi:hypothetical protein